MSVNYLTQEQQRKTKTPPSSKRKPPHRQERWMKRATSHQTIVLHATLLGSLLMAVCLYRRGDMYSGGTSPRYIPVYVWLRCYTSTYIALVYVAPVSRYSILYLPIYRPSRYHLFYFYLLTLPTYIYTHFSSLLYIYKLTR